MSSSDTPPAGVSTPSPSLPGSSPSSQSSPTSSPGSSADPSSVLSPVTTPSQPPTTIDTPTTIPTTTTPTTTTTPQVTTPQTTPVQATTTPSDGGTTSSVQSPTSDSVSATATPLASASVASTPSVRTITSSSSFTSQVATTVASTNAAGSVVFVTSTVPEVFTTSITTTTGGSGNSNHNTGIIVGAVVGGATGVILLLVLIFCIRRRSHRDEFDGNFDPDRVLGHSDVVSGTLPNVDLAEEVTPFPQSQPHLYPDQRPSMRQHGKSPYVSVPTSGNEYYPSGVGVDTQPRKYMQHGGAASGAPPAGAYIPPVNMYGAGPVDWHNPRPEVSPPPSTASNYTSSTATRATKEREALARIGEGSGLGLVAPQEAAEGSGEVVVHQDAGRAPVDEHAPPREIPPAYESIQRD